MTGPRCATRSSRSPRPTTNTGSSRSRCCFPSADKAQAFLERSRSTLRKCEGASIDIDHDEVHSTWEIGDADVAGEIITQSAEQRDAGGWGCQHAMAAASNLVIEAWACSNSINNEAKAISTEMLKNAAKK